MMKRRSDNDFDRARVLPIYRDVVRGSGGMYTFDSDDTLKIEPYNYVASGYISGHAGYIFGDT